MSFLSISSFFAGRSDGDSTFIRSASTAGVKAQNHSYADEQVLTSLSDYIRHPEFKRLLNQILSVQASANLNSIAIVSEYPGEGKTFLVGALALAYAKFLSSRVLIVDTLRQPRKGKLYYECLAGDYDPTLGELAERNGKIDFISAEDAQAQSSDSYDFHLGRYIQGLKKQYDVLLFDTCALRSVSAENIDPLILGQYVDFSLLVTSPKSMRPEVMTGVVRQFRKHNINVVGSIFNPGVAA